MKFDADKYTKPCGCRSVGECFCNIGAEGKALDALVDAFAKEMKKKLRAKMTRGENGWDSPARTVHQIEDRLKEVSRKGDPIDIANFAAFWWNRL